MTLGATQPANDATKLPTSAWLALVVGLASAMVSAYWAAGGRLLLGTVGGAFERLGQSGGAAAVGLLSVVVLLKLVAAALPLVAIRSSASTSSCCRFLRGLAWVEAGVLAGYGLVYTGVGLLVEAGILSASADADRHAMAWHAFFWDPWFLLWGILVIVALLSSRPHNHELESW